jgi:hypothetical protein
MTAYAVANWMGTESREHLGEGLALSDTGTTSRRASDVVPASLMALDDSCG